MKLSGWKRIGIVASVVWVIGAGIYTFQAASDEDMRVAGEITQVCSDSHRVRGVADNECLKRGEDYAVEMLPYEKLEAALVALVPVPFGWGFVYLVLFVVRWVKRGFSEG